MSTTTTTTAAASATANTTTTTTTIIKIAINSINITTAATKYGIYQRVNEFCRDQQVLFYLAFDDLCWALYMTFSDPSG